MTIKKYYGNTIDEARKKAKKQLGNTFVIIETHQEEPPTPSSITVMLDRDIPIPTNGQTNNKVIQSNKDQNVSFIRSDSGLKKPINYIQKVFNDSPLTGLMTKRKKAPEYSRPSLFPDKKPKQTATPAKTISHKIEQKPLSRREHSLFHYETVDETNGHSQPASQNNNQELQREISGLKKQINKLETKISESIILANIHLVSHPVFQQLLKAGIPSVTIANWFKKIMDEGYFPDQDTQTFSQELKIYIQEQLPDKPGQAPGKNIVFIGNPGSGKTSIIRGLITDKRVLKKRKIAVVDVCVPSQSNHYTILEPFCQDHKIPFFPVTSGAELTQIKSKLEHFDHVLFDTPSISLTDKHAVDQFWKIRQLLASITPLEIHMVVHANSQFVLQKNTGVNPVQPDFIAITHLDENQKWGQLIPFIHPYQCGIRYVSNGPSRIEHFEPSLFVETIFKRS